MGYSKRQMLDREEDIINFAGIGDFIDSPVKQYSSGMYVRLAFAVASEVDPQILLADEILAVGDLEFQEKCFDRFREFKRRGKTILLVTHSLGHVIDYCDRALLMDGGRLIFDGSSEEVARMYESRSQGTASHANPKK